MASIVCASVGAVHGDDQAQATFEELFGSPIRNAQATRDDADDKALAQQMLDTAEALGDATSLRVLLCVGAFDLAKQAMDKAVALAPARRVELDDKLIEAHNIRFRRAARDDRDAMGGQMIEAALRIGDQRLARGDYVPALSTYRSAQSAANLIRSPQRDAIQEAMSLASARMATQRRVESLAGRLEQMPDNERLIEQLVRMCVVELDNPSAAARYADVIEDEQTAARLRLADKPTHLLEADEAMQLADWYRALAEQAPPASKRAMHRRQRHYLQWYLSVCDSGDLQAVQARLRLEQLAGLASAQEQGAGNEAAAVEAGARY